MINWIKENKCVFAFFVFVNISVVLNVLLRTETDFYHMAVSGKWIVEHRSIQYQNDQFILDGYDTVIQQWLYCVLIYMSVWSYAPKITSDKCAIYSYYDGNSEYGDTPKRYTIEFMRKSNGRYYVEQVQGRYGKASSNKLYVYLQNYLEKTQK